jgi:hypothetical protein
VHLAPLTTSRVHYLTIRGGRSGLIKSQSEDCERTGSRRRRLGGLRHPINQWMAHFASDLEDGEHTFQFLIPDSDTKFSACCHDE